MSFMVFIFMSFLFLLWISNCWFWSCDTGPSQWRNQVQWRKNMNQSPRWHLLCHQPHCPNLHLKVKYVLCHTALTDIACSWCQNVHNFMQIKHDTLWLTHPQSSLLRERTLSRPTSCLTRVSLRSRQLTAQVSCLQKQSLTAGLPRSPAITATHPSPTPHLPSLLRACSTVLNSTTTFCPMTSLRLLQR